MNSKAAKRIRRVAKIIASPKDFEKTVERLKKEYEKLPYHKRKKRGIQILSHSAVAREHHQ